MIHGTVLRCRLRNALSGLPDLGGIYAFLKPAAKPVKSMALAAMKSGNPQSKSPLPIRAIPPLPIASMAAVYWQSGRRGLIALWEKGVGAVKHHVGFADGVENLLGSRKYSHWRC